MQNDDKPAMASDAKDPLSDDDIIEFAETVLADLDGGGPGQGAGEAPAEDDDDIIDLTEVAEKPESGDDFLDLTEDIDLDPSAEEDILELEDFAETDEDEIDVAFELQEDLDDPSIEELSIEDDAVVEVDDDMALAADIFEDDAPGPAVDEKPSDKEDDEAIIDLFSTDEETETPADPVDAPSASEIEPAFGTADRNSEDADQRAEAGESEVLPDLEDQISEADPAALQPSSVFADAPAPESSTTADPREKLELTEADRRILEEELSLDIADETPVGTAADAGTAAIGADIPELDAVGFESRRAAGDDHLADADPADTEADGAKATVGRSSETFDFDFDETAEEDAAVETDFSAEPAAADEELSVDSLLADDEDVGSRDARKFPAEAETASENGIVEPAEITDTGFAKQTAAAASKTDERPGGAPDLDAAIAAAGSLSSQAAGYRSDRDEPSGPLSESGPETPSGAPFEALVEQAVKKLLGEKIDAMLADAIDKAVTTEIERLKTLLLGNMDRDS